MNYEIREMQTVSLAENEIWGNKAAYLSDARQNGIPVPDGFCVLVKEKKIDRGDTSFSKDLEDWFHSLKKRTGALKYIARSSSPQEDRSNHIFPGIYKSKKDIRYYKELMDNIVLCYESFSSDIADMYLKEINVRTLEPEAFCIMIQEQVDPDYSGVAFTRVPIPGYYESDSCFVEMVKDHCQDMLQGKMESNAYIVDRMRRGSWIRRLHCPSAIAEVLEEDIFGKLVSVINKISKLYGRAFNIEWGYVNKEIVIYQIRPLSFRHIKIAKKRLGQSSLGLKANAMKKFRELGLFEKELLIIDPGKSVAEIEAILQTADFLSGAITIRYSYQKELGLPRYFANNKQEAFRFICDTYQSLWTIILHESISVRDSYELYLDKQRTVLEHVPGMWESDNKSAVDTWVYENGFVKAFAVNCLRRARYENASSNETRLIEPYTETEIRQIAEKIFPYLEKIRKNWMIEDGENFHFVQDADQKVYFLNHRRFSEIEDCAKIEDEENLTVISSREDLLRWDGGNILLKIDLKRGEEVLMKEYVSFLKKSNVKVFVSFGILSHPSILLREMGIEVYPLYTLHKKYEFSLERIC